MKRVFLDATQFPLPVMDTRQFFAEIRSLGKLAPEPAADTPPPESPLP
jgi:hypothetical protein